MFVKQLYCLRMAEDRIMWTSGSLNLKIKLEGIFGLTCIQTFINVQNLSAHYQLYNYYNY